MIGYIFETTNNKTGDKYIGKRYAVNFDKNYFGEVNSDNLSIAIEKYGRNAFSVKMLRAFEDIDSLEKVFMEYAQPVSEAPKKKGRKKQEVVDEQLS